MRPATDELIMRALVEGPELALLKAADAIVYAEDGWHRTLTPSAPSMSANEILFSNLQGPDIEAEIDAVLDAYCERGLDTRWSVYDWTRPADLGERLLHRGGRRQDWAAFSIPMDLRLSVRDEVRVEQVFAGTAGMEAALALLAEGFSLSPANVDLRRQRYGALATGPDAPLQMFVTTLRGELAGVSSAYVGDGWTYMGTDYVRPPYLRQGLFRAAIEARLKAGRRMGVRVAAGHGDEASSARSIRRLGLRPHYTYASYAFDFAR